MKTVMSVVSVLMMLFCPVAVLGEERPMESWTCSYKDGKGLDDLLAARDFELKQAEKAGIDLGNQFLWSLYKGDRDFDFVWLAPHDSWVAFNQRQDSVMDSALMSKAQARYDNIATCRAVLGAVNILNNQQIDTGSDPYMVTTTACKVKDGVSRQDMTDLEGHIGSVRAAMGDTAPLITGSIRMITRGPNTPDWVMFNKHKNMTERGKSLAALRQMEQSQSQFRHMRTKVDCSFSLWRGQQVMGAN